MQIEGHDFASLSDVRVGDAFLCAPRKDGTFFVTLCRHGRSNVKAAATFSNLCSNPAPLAWHVIRFWDNGPTLSPLAPEDACALAWRYTRAAELDATPYSED
jgi:hypothetical protein